MADRPQNLTRRNRAGARLAALLFACTALAAAAPSPAAASSDQITIFDAAGGLTAASPAQQAQNLDRMKSLGVDVVRIVMPWRFFAPNPGQSRKPSGFDASNPASYPQGAFGVVDNAVRGIYQRGMLPLLTPSAPIPDWASSTGNSAFFGPDPGEFQQFVKAVGLRYSGYYCPACNGYCVLTVCTNQGGYSVPRVYFWSVWNEPNIPLFLRPQHQNGHGVAGAIYRDLWLAAKDGLDASSHAGEPVLIGETSPGPGRGGTDPVAFMRQTLCVTAGYRLRQGCQRIDAAGWAQHPYDPYDPPYRTSRGLLTIRSMGRLESGLIRAARAGATTKGLPVFVTEYGVESKPDPVGVSERRQAEYLSIAEYLLYRDPNVASFSQYLMDDDGGGLKYSFQTGLRFSNDAPKDSYDGFAIPLVAQRTHRGARRVHIWGEVRPGSGPYQVHVLYRSGGGRAHQLRTIRTDRKGYFRFSSPYRGNRSWRAIARAPDGTLLKSPFIHSFVFRG